jgi:hypothetical protein
LKEAGRENADARKDLLEEENYEPTKILRGDVRARHWFINCFQSNGAGANDHQPEF